MRAVLIPVVFITFFGCRRPIHDQKEVANSVKRSDPVAAAVADESTVYRSLFACYRDINISKLYIFSSDNGMKDGEPFAGVPIDTTSVKLFPKKYRMENDDWYATYKFDIDQNRIGLITRVPSEYYSSSIKLFIYYKDKKAITDEFELAETWGDGGAAFTKTSWLYLDKNGCLKCVIWQSYYYDGDEELKEPSIDENKYFVVNLQNSVTDTVSRNAKKLFNSFKPGRSKPAVIANNDL